MQGYQDNMFYPDEEITRCQLVKILWNWLMPQLFAGVGLLTWWKAFVLCLMVRLMVGGSFNSNKN